MPAPINVRVPHPRGGMAIGKVVRFDSGGAGYSPFYIVDIGEYGSVKVPAHKVEAENRDELTKQFKSIFAEVQQRLQEKCFDDRTRLEEGLDKHDNLEDI